MKKTTMKGGGPIFIVLVGLPTVLLLGVSLQSRILDSPQDYKNNVVTNQDDSNDNQNLTNIIVKGLTTRLETVEQRLVQLETVDHQLKDVMALLKQQEAQQLLQQRNNGNTVANAIQRQDPCETILTKPWPEFKWFCRHDIFQSADSLLNTGKDLHIVQIGAHVGFEPNDPLAQGMSLYLNPLVPQERQRIHWTFVEPSPPNYKRLTQNLAQHSSLCDMKSVNAAVVSDDVTTNNGGMTFYSVSDTIDPETGYDSKSGQTLPHWITQVSSLTKKPILFNARQFTQKGLNVNDYIVETQVTALRYSDLMQQVTGGGGPWLCLIDTEGFDCDIVLGISPTSASLPQYLLFETAQCEAEKLQRAFAHLQQMGYTVKDIGGRSQNAVAILNKQ